MNTVRWGLVSTAKINRLVIPAIRMSQRGIVSAVASRDLAAAKSYAAKWDIPYAYGSYQDMLESGQVDAVYISLPNHLHAEWTIRALEAGIHVLCEKPFATSLDEVDAMIASARRADRRLAEAFMYRHHPQAKIIGEWVHRGRLGEIVMVRGVLTFKITDRAENVRLQFPIEQGGGCLWDVGIYPLSLAQYVYGGPPVEVVGLQQIGDTGVDENFTGQMRYPNGGLAQIAGSFRTPFHLSAEILGENGSLRATRPFNLVEDARLTFLSVDGEQQDIPIPKQDLYLGEIEDMQAAILDGAPNYLRLDETRNHIATALALYESAQLGRPVAFSLG